jgi:hypothetical protein
MFLWLPTSNKSLRVACGRQWGLLLDSHLHQTKERHPEAESASAGFRLLQYAIARFEKVQRDIFRRTWLCRKIRGDMSASVPVLHSSRQIFFLPGFSQVTA